MTFFPEGVPFGVHFLLAEVEEFSVVIHAKVVQTNESHSFINFSRTVDHSTVVTLCVKTFTLEIFIIIALCALPSLGKWKWVMGFGPLGP